MVQGAPSYLTRLDCPECDQSFDADELHSYCQDCASPLLARYDLDGIRENLAPDRIKDRPRGMWRWSELLPVRGSNFRATLGEGDTPLLSADRLGAALGLQHLSIKDEGSNPTGTFKDRGLALAVARAFELGVREFVIPTAGNAGGALAAYAEVAAFGADLRLVDGLIDEAGRQGAQEASRGGWFDVSTLKEPYRLEGKKTMGLEIAEAFDYRLPDVIIYPTGGGTGLIGMWKAFQELETLGWIGPQRPRMVSVQADGCAPIVKAFEAGEEWVEVWPNAQTHAAGLRVPKPFADRLIMRALYDSRGAAVAVSEAEIRQASKDLSQMEGVFAAPEGAATLAAARTLAAEGWLSPEDQVVLFNTGSGLKYV